MRIISGDKKGYRLKAPKGKDVRPTEDRIKESMFNILQSIDYNSVALDLFAGSGSIGMEFLSRGAEKAYFVDKSKASIMIIKDNLNHTGLVDKSQVLKMDSIKAIGFFGKSNIKFDYIFIDPPYGKDLIIRAIESINYENILFENGIIIAEHEKTLDLPNEINEIRKIDRRNYGSKSLTFYTYNEEA